MINKNNFCKFQKSLKFCSHFAWSIGNHESNETRRLCPHLKKSYGIRLTDSGEVFVVNAAEDDNDDEIKKKTKGCRR